MKKMSKIRFLIAIPVLAFAAFLFSVPELDALAQNTNSSSTEHEGMEHQNTNRQRRGRRSTSRNRRRSPRTADTNAANDAGGSMDANLSQDADADANVSADLSGETSDLSGTYMGQLRMTGAHEMSGQATLTINGNQFTLEAEGMSHRGRVYAITTRGYTGASFYFGDLTDSSTNTPVVASVRSRQSGKSLTLSPAPGARTRLTFNGRM